MGMVLQNRLFKCIRFAHHLTVQSSEKYKNPSQIWLAKSVNKFLYLLSETCNGLKRLCAWKVCPSQNLWSALCGLSVLQGCVLDLDGCVGWCRLSVPGWHVAPLGRSSVMDRKPMVSKSTDCNTFWDKITAFYVPEENLWICQHPCLLNF